MILAIEYAGLEPGIEELAYIANCAIYEVMKYPL